MLADALIPSAMESSGGQSMLYVMESVGPGENVFVPLTGKDFADRPALDAVIRGGEQNPPGWKWGSRDRGSLAHGGVAPHRPEEVMG